MCTNGIENYCRRDVHKTKGVGKKKKINRVNTMTTSEALSWSKNQSIFYAEWLLFYGKINLRKKLERNFDKVDEENNPGNLEGNYLTASFVST